jgi:UDP-N-acetylmuramoyl-L-alanyl-D-glutamate--2,6-diaminopimelate ligase
MDTKRRVKMRLGNLIPNLNDEQAAVHITGFAIDHRKVAPGNIFGAFKGAVVNGEDFIAAAIANGAIAIVADPAAVVGDALHIADVDPRARFAKLAAHYFSPAPNMIAAVTGTNGKTSTVELTRQLWRMAGHNAASIGTLGITTATDQVSTGLTSPDIVTFLSNMAGLAREGVTHAVFEASSHGLDQHRTEGVKISVAAFTNLSRDHLDYHGDLDSYFSAKMRLFDEVVDANATAVIWADDEWSDKAITHVKKRDLRLITVGKNGKGIQIVNRTATQLGQILELRIQGEELKLNLPLIGAYQAANALTAAAIVLASGGEIENIVQHLTKLQPVRGRLERAAITRKGAPTYVDYAHTPDGLVAAIDALRPHAAGRLITVFGAGGDRDTGKRPEMGKVAAQGSDIVIVTDDNPRSEEPANIRRDVMRGCPDAIEIGDRRSAIEHAIEIAQSKDIILIAGKGHEQGQIFGAGADMRIVAFDDVSVVRECSA